jgi:hypothetical protein
VYLRIVTYEQKTMRDAEKFIQRIKWVPMMHRFEIFQEAYKYISELKDDSIDNQKNRVKIIEDRGKYLVKYRKLGSEASKEV